MLDELFRSLEVRLRQHSISAFVFGSQLERFDPSRDIDLLFVVSKESKMTAVKALLELQRETSVLLHPTFATEEQYQNNELFSVLTKNGIKLW